MYYSCYVGFDKDELDRIDHLRTWLDTYPCINEKTVLDDGSVIFAIAYETLEQKKSIFDQIACLLVGANNMSVETLGEYGILLRIHNGRITHIYRKVAE